MTGSAEAARSLLAGEADEVAPLLLGWRLTHRTPEGAVTLELTEVEAYRGEDDPASHAFGGRTPRNAVMFGPAGHLYTYLSYGMHWCANVVTGTEGTASAVLLRAGRVVSGLELARSRRGDTVAEPRLARGPGNLGRALALGREHSGRDLLVGESLFLTPPDLPPGGSLPESPTHVVRTGPRVGVSRAADVPWRYWQDGDPTVSDYRRSPRAERGTTPR